MSPSRCARGTEAVHERVPTEFESYWNALERPAVKHARALSHRLLEFDLVPPEETVRAFGPGYYDADPVAEAFVDEVYLGRSPNEGRRMLEQSISEGVDAVAEAPDSMRRVVAAAERDPEWLAPDRVQIGAKVFRRLGPAAFSFAGASTLLAYTENSIVKPLALTGAYAGDTALNRFMETARFWIETTEPGGLDPRGAGRATAIRVRVMHVFVRRRLLQHPEWDLDAWGVPINQ